MSKARRFHHQSKLEKLTFRIVRYHQQCGLDADELEVLLQLLLATWSDPIDYQHHLVSIIARDTGKSPPQVSYYLGTIKAKKLLEITDVGKLPGARIPLKQYSLSPLLRVLNQLDGGGEEEREK